MEVKVTAIVDVPKLGKHNMTEMRQWCCVELFEHFYNLNWITWAVVADNPMSSAVQPPNNDVKLT